MEGTMAAPESGVVASSTWKMRPLWPLTNDISLIFKMDTLGKEIANIAIPAALALAADPIASLIDTAFIGHIGPVQLAAVGVSIAVFNQVSRITIFPLVSITTSFVAEEDACMNGSSTTSNDHNKDDFEMKEKKIDRINVVNEKKDEETKQQIINSQEINREDMSTSGKSMMHNQLSKLEIKVASEVETGLVSESGRELGKNRGDASTVREKISSSTHAKTTNDEQETEMTEEIYPPHEQTDDQFQSTALSSDTGHGKKHSTGAKYELQRRRHMASVSSALVIGSVLGLFQALFLIFTAKPLLSIMGIKSGSPMLSPALEYLTLRALGAPAVLLSLAMQGIFRGFKDTRTPLYAIVAGDVTNVLLDPIFMFVLRMKVGGAAIAHVISQYLISLILLLTLMRRVEILPPSIRDLQLGRFLRNGMLLLWRVVAVTFCVTLAASLAARLGSTPMAAFQICLQVWMTTSLLADGLAVAAQAILASAFATKDHDKATHATTRAMQLSLALGAGLALVVGIGLRFGSKIFTKDMHVTHLIYIAIPFVAATQPINSLAFVLDGINFGASDFAYTAYSMIVVSVVSILCLCLLSKSFGFVGIWIGLTIYMGLRTVAGYWRVGTATGPWRFRRS